MFDFFLFLISSICLFATGYFTKAMLSRIDDYDTLSNCCPQCKVKVFLPKNQLWEYKHKCENGKNETFITRKTVADFLDPKEEIVEYKTSGEGKTLC